MTRTLLSTICGLIFLVGPACSQNEAKADVETAPAVSIVEVNEAPLGNSPDDFEALLEEYLALNQRLENISYRILSANSENCPETQRDIGIKAHTIYDYPSELQMYARVYLDLGVDPAIRVVAQDSPADLAGLQPGDQILSLGAYDMISGETAAPLYKALSRREFENSVAQIRIARAGEEQSLTITPQSICGYPAQLFYSERVNAHTDGEEIWVTSELLRQVGSDTSLALILAHELAHATQGHLFLEQDKYLELEADRLSLIYLKQAGFDPEEAVKSWKANSHNHKQDISGTHPSPEERLKVLQKTLSEF